MHIIILNEHQLSLQIAIFAEVNNVLDVTLAIIIPRMRFARENKLDGPGFVSGQLDDILELLENQRGAFVGGEASGKTNRQRVGIEQLIEGNKIALGQPLSLNEQSPPGEFNQFAAQLITECPEFLVGNEFGI